MFEIFQYTFMQRALIAGSLIGIICPLIGVFIVLRRMSLIGDSLSHVALSGVLVGIITNIYPIFTAILASIIAAISIEKLRKNYEKYAELSIAIVLSLGIGISVILIGLAKSINFDLMGYLFGSITTVLSKDLLVIFLLSIFIIFFVKFLYKELFYITFDEESARLSGIPIKTINTIFIIIVAITITLSMRIVGALLVSSLMVIPVACSMQVAKSFKQTLFFSVTFAQISIFIGIISSYYLEIAPGGTIVVTSTLFLVFTLFSKSLINKFFKNKI